MVEVVKDLIIIALNTVRRAKRLGEIGILPGAGQEIGSEIILFRHRIDQVALGREQIEIIIPSVEMERPQPGVKF